MQVVGDLGHRLVRMAQIHFYTGNEGAVYPVFGCGAARLADDGAEIAGCETHAVGIVAQLMLLAAMQVDQLDETVKDGLLTRAGSRQLVDAATVELVIVVHLCGYEAGSGGAIVVLSVNEMPKGFEDAQGGQDVRLLCRDLKVAHLTVKGCWHLPHSEGHGEGSEKCYAIYLQVVGKADGSDDGAGTEIDQCAGSEVTVLQVEVDRGLALCDDAKTVVADAEWRFLGHHQAKRRRFAVYHAEFFGEKYPLTNLRVVGRKYFPHLRHVQQSWCLFHTAITFLLAKIIILSELPYYFCINRTKRTFLYSKG